MDFRLDIFDVALLLTIFIYITIVSFTYSSKVKETKSEKISNGFIFTGDCVNPKPIWYDKKPIYVSVPVTKEDIVLKPLKSIVKTKPVKKLKKKTFNDFDFILIPEKKKVTKKKSKKQ